MPITLSDARNFATDKMSMGVIDEFRKDPLLGRMVFDDTVTPTGQTLAYTYNRVTTQPVASFRALNTEYTPQEAKTTEHTVTLKPFGGKFQVDRVIQNHMKGVANHVAFQLQQKIKATKALFSDTFINGDTGITEESFDGLAKAISGSSTDMTPEEVMDLSNSNAIKDNYQDFLYQLDVLIADLDGEPDIIMVNRKMKAVFNSIARLSGFFTTSDIDAFGRPVTKYAGIEICAVGDKPGTSLPIIGIDPVTKLTSLYVVRLGLDGVHAVSPEGAEVIKTYPPNMEAPGAVKDGEVEMVSAIVLKNSRAAGRLNNIKL